MKQFAILFAILSMSIPCAAGPIIELSQTSFNFTAEENGPNPDDQTLTITNIGAGTLDWTITEGYLDPQDPNIFIESDYGLR